jgi:hypothetical protein
MKEKKLFFTKEAMQILSRVVLSCPPTYPREEGLQHEKVIMLLAKEKRGVSLDEIGKKIGRKVFIYDDIANYARSLKKYLLDENLVAGYFGGEKHINKIIQDFKMSGADALKNGSFIFQHVLKPVIFEVTGGKISGTYQNGKISVRIGNLVLADKKESVQTGDAGLIHFSLVVLVSQLLAETEKAIFAEQNSHPVFREILQRLDGKTLKSDMQCKLAESALARHLM